MYCGIAYSRSIPPAIFTIPACPGDLYRVGCSFYSASLHSRPTAPNILLRAVRDRNPSLWISVENRQKIIAREIQAHSVQVASHLVVHTNAPPTDQAGKARTIGDLLSGCSGRQRVGLYIYACGLGSGRNYLTVARATFGHKISRPRPDFRPNA